MSSSDAKNLEKILIECLRIKSRLAPESETDDKKKIMERIRLAFPQLEKRDCMTPYSCFKLVIPTAANTLPAAKKLIPKFKQLIPYLFKRESYASTETHFGQIRVAFNESPPQVRKYVHITMRTTARQKAIQGAKADERVEMKLLDPFRVSLSTFLENIALYVESNSFGALLSALESASGARAIELINKKVATFEAVPSLPGFVRQIGQAKTKGKKVQPITKPIVGMTVDRFLQRLAFLRTFTDADVEQGLDNPSLAKKYERSAVDHLQSIYPNLKKGSGTHKMRAVYSKASYLIHNPNEEVSPSKWMKDVLGHGSFNSLKHYDSVIVTRGHVLKPADVPMALAEMGARLAALETQKSDEQNKKIEEVHEEVFITKKKKRKLEQEEKVNLDEQHEDVLIKKQKRKIEQEEVEFITKDNKKVSIKKLKRVRNKTEEQTRDLVRQAEELLRSHNVKITKDNITFLGIGGTNASKYRTK